MMPVPHYCEKRSEPLPLTTFRSGRELTMEHIAEFIQIGYIVWIKSCIEFFLNAFSLPLRHYLVP
jgi:hypothetical protein